jgi:hypothetical protein
MYSNYNPIRMFIQLFVVAAFFCTGSPTLYAQQGKLSINNVYTTYLRNSGTIMEHNETKGYFFLYISDKIDKHTNEYTLQILDENLNKVREMKFQDSKKLSLLESAYNGATLSFLFKNEENKSFDMKIYDLDGNLKFTYSREYDKRSNYLMMQYQTMHTDEGTNKNVFELGDHGYASVLPLVDGNHHRYEVDYYASDSKEEWTYVPEDDDEHYASAEFLGSTDSLILLEVLKKKGALSSKVTPHLLGINFITKKKVFDLDSASDTYSLVPMSVIPVKGTDRILVMGSYYNKGDNIAKDFSKGLAIYEINNRGEILSKTYNTWAEDFAKYLPANSKGKIDDVGYLYLHKLIKTPDERYFVVGEGYKRKVNTAGMAMGALLALGGIQSNEGLTMIQITDMVMMEFDNKFKVVNATIYDKTNTDAVTSTMSDYESQHAIAVYLKTKGSFDYEFTTGDADNSNFSVCYNDWARSPEYNGKTFNTIHYNGSKFSTDKIELKSKASTMKVFPAKAGSIMILEYFRKDKRIDLRLEKLG